MKSRAHRVGLIASALMSFCGCGETFAESIGARFLDSSRILYTSGSTLSANETQVTVVGLPQVRLVGGTTLSLVNDRTEESIEVEPTAEDTFRATIAARLGDTLNLVATKDDESEGVGVFLDDALLDLERPFLCTGCGPVARENEMGNLTLRLGELNAGSSSLVIFNEANDLVVEAEGTMDFEIEGLPGDRICFFSHNGSATSPTFCETASSL